MLSTFEKTSLQRFRSLAKEAKTHTENRFNTHTHNGFRNPVEVCGGNIKKTVDAGISD